MASTIKLKNGSGEPLATDLVTAEPAFDLTNKRLYTEDSGGTVIEVGTNPSTITIPGGTIDNTVIGGTTTAAGSFTTLQADTSLNVDGTVTADGLMVSTATGSSSITPTDITIKTETSASDWSTTDEWGRVVFYSDDVSNGGAKAHATIGVSPTASGGGLSNLVFKTSNSTPSLVKRMDINEVGDISFYDSSASQAFYWDASAASLGIGTTSPSTTLDVVNTAASTTVARVNNASASSGAYAQFQVDSDAATAYFGVSGSGNTVNGGAYDSDFAYLFASNNASGLNIGTGSGGPLIKFYTGGSAAANERMRIDSSGNVGIGDTSPSDKLSLEVGSANEGVSIYYSGTEVGSFRNDAANATINANNASLKLETGGTERMRINSGGDVSFRDTSANEAFYWDASAASLGIGTDSPAYKLDIQDASTPIFRMMDTTNDCTLLMYPQNTSAIFGTYSAHPLLFYTDSAEAMRIDSSGNVSVTGEKFNLGGTGNNAVFNSNFSMHFNIDADNNGSEIFAWGHNGDNTSASRLMTLDASGNLLVGGSALSFGVPTVQIGGSDGDAFLTIRRNGTGTSSQIRFYNPNGTVGEIYTSGSSTTYSTTSDYRLKENVVDMTGAVDRVKALNPSRFNFIADPDTIVDGFLAHEVADVVPEAIKGVKDAMRTEEYEVTPAVLDEDGNVVTEAVMGTREVPDYQGIDQSKLVPLLTGALQEAIARIETLEAQVATLQGN